MKVLEQINYYDGHLEFIGTTGETWSDQIWYCQHVMVDPVKDFYPDYPPGRTYLCVSIQNDIAVSRRVTEDQLT